MLRQIPSLLPPGTTVTEPDQAVDVPGELESKAILSFLGLHEGRANQIWQKWIDFGAAQHGELGVFTKVCLHELVEAEDCDIGEPGVNWAPSLRSITANEALVRAIRGFPG